MCWKEFPIPDIQFQSFFEAYLTEFTSAWIHLLRDWNTILPCADSYRPILIKYIIANCIWATRSREHGNSARRRPPQMHILFFFQGSSVAALLNVKVKTLPFSKMNEKPLYNSASGSCKSFYSVSTSKFSWEYRLQSLQQLWNLIF